MDVLTILSIRKYDARARERMLKEAEMKFQETMKCDSEFASLLSVLSRDEVIAIHDELCSIEEWLSSCPK